MDVGRLLRGGGEIRAVVRLRPHFKRRVAVIAGVMVAVVVGACAWGQMKIDQSAIPQEPGVIPIEVTGALDKFADGVDDLRGIMTGDKVEDMVSRLHTMQRQLSAIPTYYQWERLSTTVAQTGDSAVVVSQVRLSIEASAGSGDSYETGTQPWTFQAVHRRFPDAGWFLTDFTAPMVCGTYWDCDPRPAPSSSRPAYRPVYLTCAEVDAQGVEDKLTRYTIDLDAAGMPDFSTVWQHTNASCTTDILHAEPVVSSPVEAAAVKATGSGSDVVKIGTLYADCAQRFNLGNVADKTGRLGARVGEYRGVLLLCPRHPDATAIRAASHAG